MIRRGGSHVNRGGGGKSSTPIIKQEGGGPLGQVAFLDYLGVSLERPKKHTGRKGTGGGKVASSKR